MLANLVCGHYIKKVNDSNVPITFGQNLILLVSTSINDCTMWFMSIQCFVLD